MGWRRRQADAWAKFSSIDQLVCSIHTPLYSHTPTPPVIALAFLCGATRDVFWPDTVLLGNWLALITRNPSLNWAGPHWCPVLSPGAVHGISSCAPWIGEQVSVCSVHGQSLDKKSRLVLILLCPFANFPLSCGTRCFSSPVSEGGMFLRKGAGFGLASGIINLC